MKRRLHATAGAISLLLVASFWSSTVVSELFLSEDAVVDVKVAVTYALVALVLCMALTGASGFSMGGKSRDPLLAGKRRRMPIIGLNGLLVLIPAALYLSAKAQAGEFDAWFYAVQGGELVAGAVNLLLMALNIRDGRRLRRRRDER
jgi:hypothetical protein